MQRMVRFIQLLLAGSLDKWSIQSGDTAKNTRVLNALKKIYNEGIANPYTAADGNCTACTCQWF